LFILGEHMFITVSACMTQKIYGRASQNLLYMAVLDPALTTLQYVMYFRFCG